MLAVKKVLASAAFVVALAALPTALLPASAAAASTSSVAPYAVANSSGWVADAMGVHYVTEGEAMYLPCAPSTGPVACDVYPTEAAADAAEAVGDVSLSTLSPTSSSTLATSTDSASPDTVSGCPGRSYSSVFTTYVSSNWSQLDARVGPCQSTKAKYVYTTNATLYINHEDDHGQTICYSSTLGIGSSVWYETGKHLWVWSGGTDRTAWKEDGC